MSAGCRAGTTAQHVLVAHEFAVVLAQRAGSSAVAGIGRVGAAGPFPNVAEDLVKTFSRFLRCCGGHYNHRVKDFGLDEIAFDWTTQRRAFPFELNREAGACPVGKRVGFKVTNVRNRLRLFDRTKA